jgi:hypothetical protein
MLTQPCVNPIFIRGLHWDLVVIRGRQARKCLYTQSQLESSTYIYVHHFEVLSVVFVLYFISNRITSSLTDLISGQNYL